MTGASGQGHQWHIPDLDSAIPVLVPSLWFRVGRESLNKRRTKMNRKMINSQVFNSSQVPGNSVPACHSLERVFNLIKDRKRFDITVARWGQCYGLRPEWVGSAANGRSVPAPPTPTATQPLSRERLSLDWPPKLCFPQIPGDSSAHGFEYRLELSPALSISPATPVLHRCLAAPKYEQDPLDAAKTPLTRLSTGVCRP
ncbi:hypothetical protein MKX08_009260 [Trichoderma sp. CBMAI-0020]|nr:hypothetical protein MKX08_009260 [Trichoderma sp. CBMAI-0020]